VFVIPNPEPTNVLDQCLMRTWAQTNYHRWLEQVGLRELIPELRTATYRQVQRVPTDFNRKYTQLYTGLQELKVSEIQFVCNRWPYTLLRHGPHCLWPVYPKVNHSYKQLIPRRVTLCL